MWRWRQDRGIKTKVTSEVPDKGGMNLPEVQREFAGMWVAFKGGSVIEARPTPYELVGVLHERSIRDTTIMRIPSPEEPELVGLG